MMGVEECIDNNNVGKADCSDEERGNDDDCMVFLPGEETSNFEKAVESHMMNRIATAIGFGRGIKDGV